MTPPTAAQGSVAVMRRQTSHHDVTPSPYYVAQPGQTNRNGLAAENGHKTKKSWGERLKLGGSKAKEEDRRVLQQQQYQQQQAQEMANNNYLLHEYRSKYGTLSGGSALSKSMKYAETWLYGTVSVRQPGNTRPNVMLYHPPPIAVIPAPGDAPRHIIPHVAMCSCPEFVGGTMRSKKNTSSTGICKKCGGSRVLWRGAGTMRASTVRLPDNRMGGTVRVGQTRVRPSLMNLNPNAVTPDPYDLMRRNRLGASTEADGDADGGGTLRSRGRVRAKSTSPGRHNMRRSPSPPTFTLRKAGEAGRARRDMSWESDEVLDNHVDPADKRKSILECDVNPYQLIAKYLKNGTEGEGQNNNNSYHGNMNGNDEDLDDELSDDLSDNALENGDDTTRPRPAAVFHRKTEHNGRKATDVGYKLQSVDKTKAASSEGVTISGRRIRVFSGSSSAAGVDEEFVEDDVDDEPETSSIPGPPKPKTTPVSMIPRLSSPKRPQRKLKTPEACDPKTTTTTKTTPTDEAHKTKAEEIESELHGESSPSNNNNQIERRSNLVSSNIKSILKKPPASSSTTPQDTETTTSSLRLMREVRTFNDTIKKPDAVEDVHQSAPQTRVISSSNFYLPTFQEYKQQNRKKKQVQFNVQASSDGNNTAEQVLDEENVNSVPEITVRPASHLLDGGLTRGGVGDRDGPVVSGGDTSGVFTCDRPMKVDDIAGGTVTVKASEKPVKLQYFGDHVEDVRMAIKDTDNGAGMAPTNLARSHTHLNTDVEDDRSHSGTVVTLRRSLSDCQASSSDDGAGLMFNDTMRLRLRAGRRVDSRQAFSHPGPSSDLSSRGKRVVSPGRPRPKEPPPPPPLPSAPDTNISSPKLFDNEPKENPIQNPTEVITTLSQTIVAPPEPPPRQIFPFTKKQIQNINNQKRQLTLKTSPSTTLLRENTRKSRPNSCIPQLPIPTSDGGSTNIVSKIKHRNSDPGPANVSFRLVETPSINDQEDRTSITREEGTTCTIVTVCPESPDIHRLQITTEGKVSPKHERKTSILINGDNTLKRHDIQMAVTMDEIQKNKNKVTINVGGADTMTSWPNANNSCTIIDTSHSNNNNNSLTRINNCTNQVIIPVTPEPIYNHSSNVQVNNDKNHITIIDQNSENSVAKIHHDYEVLEMLMDPVEAVKRHLVPHVCGKSNPDGGAALVSPSAMERLNSLLISQRQEYSETETSGSVVEVSSPELSLSDVKYSSVTNSECSDKTLYKDQENNGISVHYFTSPCIPRFVLGDETTETEDKPDDDDEDLHKDIYDDAENIYESIKDPIYEEIGLPDTPPPLPLSPPPSLDDLGDDKRTSRSIFEGASKYDILNYLVDAKERGYVESDYNSSTNGDEIVDGKETPQEMTSLGELSSRVSNLSNASDSSEDSCNIVITTSLDTNASNKMRKSAADIERNDSGVGSETSKSSRSRWQQIPAGCIREDQIHMCEDCDQHVETQVTDSGVMFAPLVCRKCAKKRAERKETIAEIVETEEKYGGDLQIILEEFYRPMLVAGLLTSEQLSAIFLNVEELLENNSSLAEKLRDALEIALEQGDEDLLTVNIGSLFLEAAPMLHAFESYCTRQGGASILLANLEKEKELLRIFLRVSQMENAVLRRMNLNSFLMVPVQRVTKYPLLLARLYKVTPVHHQGRELLKQAQHKIELHLEHMNSVAKDISTTKLWRRISIINGRRSSSEIDMINIKLRKMAVDVLDWNHDEVKFAMEGRMLYTNPTDNNWRKGRTIKLNPINALLVTNGKTSEDYRPEDELLLFPRKSGVREATLLLVKEKCGRYALLREPLFLDKCIVCSETEWEDYFEVQELATKDTFIFKAEDSERTKLWYHQLQFHSQGLGAWRRRRNALANIMINGMLTRN